MKRLLPFAAAFFALSLIPAPSNHAQAQDAVAAAAREEAAENYRNLSARVERLEEANHAYQNRIEKLERELFRVRDELERVKNRNENAATMDKITKLQDAIKQVDEARLDDNKRVVNEMKNLRSFMEKNFKTLATPPPSAIDRTDRTDRNDRPTPSTRPDANPPRTAPPSDNGYRYTIKKGDTLSGILSALKSENYKITRKQLEDANPRVNWDKLQVGKEIIIPPPSP